MIGVASSGGGLLADVEALERARLSRDPRFDGRFFIAVTSTRIYCRPICPARSPRPEHVRYFATAAEAAAAGFRPCLRCRPEAAPGTPAWLGTSGIVRRALRLIDDGALDEQSVEDLAARLGVGPRHLRRLFAQHVGASPLAVAQTRRLHFAKRLLDDTTLPITEIALAAGFGSVRRFNAAIQAAYRRAPRELRRRRAAAHAPHDVALRLSFRPPYNWTAMSAMLAARAIDGVERAGAGGYARIVNGERGPFVVRVAPLAGAGALELRVAGAPSSMLLPLSSTARRMFDLGADPDRIDRTLARDPLLAPLVTRRPGLRIPGAWDPFECAVRAVLERGTTAAGARGAIARLVERAGQPVATGVDGLTHAFPSAAAIASADLEGLGLDPPRTEALRQLARAVADGELDFAAAPDEAVAVVAALPGLGPSAAQFVALHALGDPDAFPAGDWAPARIAGADWQRLDRRSLEARAETWRPWRAYAALHLWCAAIEQGRPVWRDDAEVPPETPNADLRDSAAAIGAPPLEGWPA